MGARGPICVRLIARSTLSDPLCTAHNVPHACGNFILWINIKLTYYVVALADLFSYISEYKDLLFPALVLRRTPLVDFVTMVVFHLCQLVGLFNLGVDIVISPLFVGSCMMTLHWPS